MRRAGFDPWRCSIPSVWCGSKTMPAPTQDVTYTRPGTSLECMKKGFGAGAWTEKKKLLPPNSLQQIKWVGEKYEGEFVTRGISDTDDLIGWAREHDVDELEELLRDVFTKRGGALDGKAFNSCLMFLYRHGVGDLPQCEQL